MDNDDKPIGQILNRRDVLKLFGISSAAFLAGCAPGVSELLTDTPFPTSILEATGSPLSTATAVSSIPACVVRPELTEGPYFVDEMINRSDIRSDPSDGSVREGLPLQLTFRVSRVNNSCAPLKGAIVDVWHCDALGILLRCDRSQFQHRGPEISARLSGDRLNRDGTIHHDLPRLVSGQSSTHPLQDPDRYSGRRNV